MPVATVDSYVDYVPNPGYPSVSGSGGGGGGSPAVQADWQQINYTTSGSANTATRLSSTHKLASRAIINTPSSVDSIGIGPNSSANGDSLPAGAVGYLIEMPDGSAFDLYDWYVKSASASQPAVILYVPAQ